MRETAAQAYVRGQQEMRDLLALVLEIGLDKEVGDKVRAISTFAYCPPEAKLTPESTTKD